MVLNFAQFLRFSPHYPISSLSSGAPTVPNDYKYNGKEFVDDLGLNMLDYGARLYDPLTGRWNGVDALAESYASSGTYNYVLGNPVLMVDPDGMRNMVYVVFLQSSGLNAAQKSAVIAEMQRIYDDVIGLRGECGESVIKVTEFDQAKRGRIYGEYLDPSDAVVTIGSVNAVNTVRQRCQTTCYGAEEDSRNFVEYGNLCPELSENRASYSDPKGLNRGQFVGISSDRTKNPFMIDAKATYIQALAFLGVHGTGHNVNLGHGEDQKYYPGSLHLTVMVDGRDMIGDVSAEAVSLGFRKMSDWLNPKYNKILAPYFREKFNGVSPLDNYQNNVKNNVRRPINEW